MGLLDAIGTGLTEAAPVAAKTAESYVQAQIDEAKLARLAEMKNQIEKTNVAEERARVAGVVGGVSRTKDVPIAGPTIDGSSLGVESQPKTEGEYSREVGDALTKTGMINESGKFYERADRSDDRHELRTTQAAKQKSDDEKWHAQFAQQAAYNKAHLAMQGAQLGLKAQEKKEFDAAADAYSTYKAQYDVLVAQKADPDSIRSIKSAMDRAALSLKQFKVDVGDVNPSQLKLQIASGINSAEKVIKDLEFATDPESVAARDEAKATRRILVKQMGVLANGGGDTSGGNVTFEMVNGKLVPSGGGKPAAAEARTKPTASGSKPAVPGIINDKPVAPTSADFTNVETARAARKAKADADTAARMEAQRKRGEEIDAFNSRVK